MRIRSSRKLLGAACWDVHTDLLRGVTTCRTVVERSGTAYNISENEKSANITVYVILEEAFNILQCVHCPSPHDQFFAVPQNTSYGNLLVCSVSEHAQIDVRGHISMVPRIICESTLGGITNLTRPGEKETVKPPCCFVYTASSGPHFGSAL